MPGSETKYEPLQGTEKPISDNGYLTELKTLNKKISFWERNLNLLKTSFAFLALLNAALGVYWISYHESATLACQSAETTPRIPVIYDSYHEGFDDDDIAKSDSYWSKLFPDGNGVVSLSDEMAKNLPSSIRAPEENNQSLYMMSGYHSLHCLVIYVRHIFRKYYMAQDSSEAYRIENGTWEHTKHCIGNMRQALLCNLDETLLAQPDHSHDPGDGQEMQCKSLKPINEWLVSHRHFAGEGHIIKSLGVP